jgi:predicted GNAT superfamily acetyltransferase
MAEFKDAMSQRESNLGREIRSDRLKAKWVDMVDRDNDDYRHLLRDAQGIERGITTENEIFAMMKNPVIVSDRALPWVRAPWRFNEQILLGTYPHARKVEAILGGSSNYTVVSLPRFEINLDVMTTLNKCTELVDYSHNYLGPGTVPKYWLIQN